ncbi:uncharacterized protein [Musca autumnalis]|uniref:uncharacterized protein n=1 Tax=Musca autumnalis TaxID=221902 RepID=UPI003CF66925
MPTSRSLHRPKGTSNGDMCTVRLENGRKKATLLSSIYMPYEDPDPPNQGVHRLLKENLGVCNVILGCDANAHHFHWGSKDTNTRGNSEPPFSLWMITMDRKVSEWRSQYTYILTTHPQT